MNGTGCRSRTMFSTEGNSVFTDLAEDTESVRILRSGESVIKM